MFEDILFIFYFTTIHAVNRINIHMSTPVLDCFDNMFTFNRLYSKFYTPCNIEYSNPQGIQYLQSN